MLTTVLVATCQASEAEVSVIQTHLIKSAIDIIFKFSLSAKTRNFGRRAMEPSASSTISQRTATGGNPASIARSTDASVCPAHFRTPPSQ